MTEDKEEQQKQRLSDGGEKKQANEREQTEKAARAAKKAAAAKAKVCPQRAAKKDEEKPLEPSPNEPVLDAYVAKIRDACGEDAVEDSSINRANDHMPTIRVKRDKWLDVAKLLRDDKELAFDYLIDLTAYDDDDFMSVVTHLYSFPRNAYLTVHVHTERDGAWVPSVTSVWPAANWNERETYDMFGIQFKGHPNLTRILMSDDWVGYPLRKDYVPLDGEV